MIEYIEAFLDLAEGLKEKPEELRRALLVLKTTEHYMTQQQREVYLLLKGVIDEADREARKKAITRKAL